MWDPASYLRFTAARSRPFFDLVAQIGAERPRAIVDLGCGPGNLTAALAKRWPDSRIRGIDSSTEMIEKARSESYPVDFEVADLRDWMPEDDVDVVVSNAALQWVPDHVDLLAHWAAALPAGAWLAVQVPGNFDSPSHRILGELNAEVGLGYLARVLPVPDPAEYAELLSGVGCEIDAWETTYLHRLPVVPGVDHPVLAWMEGTALRPIKAALDADDWAAFRRTFGERLARAFPASGGVVSFPFRRVFFVARTRGHRG